MDGGMGSEVYCMSGTGITMVTSDVPGRERGTNLLQPVSTCAKHRLAGSGGGSCCWWHGPSSHCTLHANCSSTCSALPSPSSSRALCPPTHLLTHPAHPPAACAVHALTALCELWPPIHSPSQLPWSCPHGELTVLFSCSELSMASWEQLVSNHLDSFSW